MSEGVQQQQERTSRFPLLLHRLVAALWFGAGAFLLAGAAPAAFHGASSPTEAANVVGAMLTRWHYLGLLAPLLLIALQWRRPRSGAIVLLFAAILLASAQGVLDTGIRSMRLRSLQPISALSPENPLRRRFGLLHGASSLLLLGQVVLAGVVAGSRFPE